MKHFPAFALSLLVLVASIGAQAADPVPTITSPSYVTVLVGQPFSYQITATGHPTSFGSYYLTPGYNLAYDQSEGRISGFTQNSGFFLQDPISASNSTGTGTGYLTIDIEYDLSLTRIYDLEYYPRLNPGVLTLGADGNFYSVNGIGYNNGSYILSISPQGQVLQFFHLTDYEDYFPAELITDRAGNFYGTTIQSTLSRLPTKIVRISAAGQLSVLYQFTDASAGLPYSRLCLARDGSLYGELDQGNDGAGGALFRLTPDGVFTVLHHLDEATEGSVPSALTEGADGNLYGTTKTGGPGGGGTIFEVTPAGGFTVLQSFSSDALVCNPNGFLTEGSDGNLYGTVGYLDAGYVASEAPQSAFFRVVPSGTVTVLRAMDPSVEEQRYASSFVRGADGALYGVGYVGRYPDISSPDLRRYALDGSSTSVHRFKDDQAVLADRPTVGADGNFYCLATGGGSLSQYGSFARIASNLDRSSHPGFFQGELALTNGVSYLSLSNGNTFGYYSYLSDPHFIYHFDMGYEYCFDAADGRNGIYFYDFKSGSFFYTSPTFPFPYLYDFSLNSVLYYYPDPIDPSRYNTDGTRYFYNFATGQIITK